MNEYGEIYCITSPSGKQYVGQCVKLLCSGKKWGYINRWQEHIRDSKTKNYCRLLNNAIRKYGAENFTITILAECEIDKLNELESYYIETLNTMTPNGYNLTTGGNNCRQSEETKKLKSESMLGKNKGKVYPRRERKRDEDSELPKYLRYYIDKNGKEGYRVCNHPTLKTKSFLSKKIILEEKLQLALNYLHSATAVIS